MTLNTREIYRGLRNRDEDKLQTFQERLQGGGYSFRPKGVIGRVLERHGFDTDGFGLVALKEGQNGVDSEYLIVGERDGVFRKRVDTIKGVYRQDGFTSTVIRDVENNPGYITRFVVRKGWPFVFGISFISGLLSADYWNSDLAGAAAAGAAIAVVAGLTLAVKRGFDLYLRNCEGVYYGSKAVENAVGKIKRLSGTAASD